ncbi:DUF7239 family protein [Streptomyces chartreusis]|uniref:DUF7239 family protein n=1 Tax=Streptomyces chartreusis TaxID=1969 RepID=UPI003D933B87
MDPREPKLPKWAQEQARSYRSRIETLERLLGEMRGEVGETNTSVQNYSDGDQPLPNGATVVFKLSAEGWDDYITARVERRSLVLHGGRSLAVMPWVSNSVAVRTIQR